MAEADFAKRKELLQVILKRVAVSMDEGKIEIEFAHSYYVTMLIAIH